MYAIRSYYVIALPVARACAAFAPVFLHITTVDEDLARRALVTAGKIAAQHAEVRAHGKGKRDVIIQNNAAVRADRYIKSRFLKIGVACGGNVAHGGRLSAADAFCFARVV